MDQTVLSMMDEIVSERDFMSTRSLSSIYFGGGTPSLLSSQQVAAFMDRIGEVFDVSGVEEVTFEANPDDLSLEYLEGLRRAGVDRLSIGVQSFDDEALKFMNRRHTAAQAEEAIERARAVGFDNIAIDLIFGVDGFGGETLVRSLRRAVEIGVEHIAAYHLTIEPNTLFARRVERGEFREVAESVSEREFDVVRRALTEGGFEHYEISNYAREGRRSCHNSAYWSGAEYLGVGAGAHSFGRGVRRWSGGSLDLYINGASDGSRYEMERPTALERRNEVVMTSLRRVEGVDLGEFGVNFGAESCERLLQDSRKLIESGDLILSGQMLKIPSERFLRSDMVIEQLFELDDE